MFQSPNVVGNWASKWSSVIVTETSTHFLEIINSGPAVCHCLKTENSRGLCKFSSLWNLHMILLSNLIKHTAEPVLESMYLSCLSFLFVYSSCVMFSSMQLANCPPWLFLSSYLCQAASVTLPVKILKGGHWLAELLQNRWDTVEMHLSHTSCCFLWPVMRLVRPEADMI